MTPSPLPTPEIRSAPSPGESFALPARDTSVATARHRTRVQLYGWGLSPSTSDTAQLIVSELVTNAILHTHSSQVRCLLWSTGQLLRIEVADEGSGPIPRRAASCQRRPGDDQEHGRGLLLLDALAARWGVISPDQRAGCTVWAELPAR
ncbi:ATP-binding protein [Streptomyces profundus]|uniref:ATP-binding protein n=1 Tax=Streptomyces profundus TaxID=2867410 RepID=UPI001D166FCC|nr:ATP-binding protein [Streptomyces sp. MA3_2.13]UED83361.1 ATP-binding protein [Streptomyces sp. MA3_2.13]